MGEVYRARDTKLQRFVAIKVLPPHHFADPDYRQRFEHETKVLATLNHPNIVSVYDSASEGETHYLVCELLEGQSLRERMNEGQIPLRKCMEIAIQVANGLAAAHEKGIIHRDLKPENIFLVKDGRVKVLDFGLAKHSASAVASESTMSQAAHQTEAGRLLGTVGYMSPEQVRGRATDTRSDIFSFGVVMHEMIGGKKVFAGESSVEVMKAILKEDAPDLTMSPRTVPRTIATLVNRCLEKNPEERFQSARDLGFALESVAAGSTTQTTSLAPVRRSKRALVIPAVVLVVVAAFPTSTIIDEVSVESECHISGQGIDPPFCPRTPSIPRGDPVSFSLRIFRGRSPDNLSISGASTLYLTSGIAGSKGYHLSNNFYFLGSEIAVSSSNVARVFLTTFSQASVDSQLSFAYHVCVSRSSTK